MDNAEQMLTKLVRDGCLVRSGDEGMDEAFYRITTPEGIEFDISADGWKIRLAAKAAGISWTERPDLLRHGDICLVLEHTGDTWNPLEDHGDALRLAFMLRYDVVFKPGQSLQDAMRAIVNHGAALGAMMK